MVPLCPNLSLRRPPNWMAKGARNRQVIIRSGPVRLVWRWHSRAQRGHDVLCSRPTTRYPKGPGAICFAKRTLEICDRLGYGDPVVNKGVSWNLGKVFRHDRLLYEFNLLPDRDMSARLSSPAAVLFRTLPASGALPAMQFRGGARSAAAARADPFLSRTPCGVGQRSGAGVVHRIEAGRSRHLPWLGNRGREPQIPQAASGDNGHVELRWNNRVTAVTQTGDTVTLAVECAEGNYALSCDWLIAAMAQQFRYARCWD